MRGRYAPPMFLVAAALIGLMAVLATLQYTWLGRISEAERDSRRSTLGARATAFASDVDKELTLAYVLFQLEPMLDSALPEENLASRFAVRHDRWQAASRFPRLIKTSFIASREHDGTATLKRFNPKTKLIEPVEWPTELAELRAQVAQASQESRTAGGRGTRAGTFVVRRMPGPLWEEVPALLVPMPFALFNATDERSSGKPGPLISHTVLVLDREYLEREMLPALAAQHLRGLGDGVDYQVAVVRVAGGDTVYRSAPAFEPGADAKVDAAADLFQVRTQDFPQIAADVKRFTLSVPPPDGQVIAGMTGTPAPGGAARRPSEAHDLFFRERPLEILVNQAAKIRERALMTSVASGFTRATVTPAKWRLLVKHPSGSLEAAVQSTRRRNLFVSSTVLAVLGVSMALLVLSAKRSQEVARQQMEFVATVSHELRTPLAVIRSAGDNLADGIVDDQSQIKKYGELVRDEGRRLSEMVEQILEFSGIQSGQRKLDPRPIDVSTVIGEVLSASAALIESMRIDVELDIPHDLAPVRGDEAALRRVFQNLVGNAIKYGGDGRWIGISAGLSDRHVHVTVADRGLGIAASEHERIFEPFYRATDVVAAQIQGAGLGLSLVQRIVVAHGGWTTVKSAPGEGSEFTVHLSAADPQPVAGADPRAADAPRYT